MREEHERHILNIIKYQEEIDCANARWAIKNDRDFISPIAEYTDQRYGDIIDGTDWLLDPQRRSIIELDALIDFERRRAANYGAKI